MRQKIIIVVSVFTNSICFSQVGVNTELPKVTLDVVGKPAQIAEADGIIAPRISRAELIAKTAYNANQKGALLYVTDLTGTTGTSTANVTAVGYYYFDGAAWQKIAISNDIDLRLVGTNNHITKDAGVGSNGTSGGGNNNIGIGSTTLNTNVGANNVAIGSNALNTKTSGNGNIAIGINAGNTLTSGNSNIFVGTNVGPNVSVTGSNQLNIGNWIYGDAGKIGIGVAGPASLLHLNKNLGIGIGTSTMADYAITLFSDQVGNVYAPSRTAGFSTRNSGTGSGINETNLMVVAPYRVEFLQSTSANSSVTVETSTNGNAKLGINTGNTAGNLHSSLQVNGSVAANIRTLFSGTVANTDYTIIINGNITLPAPSSTGSTNNTGRIYNLINNGGSNTISGNLSLNGTALTSYPLSTNTGNRGITVQSDGSVWYILNVF